VTVVSERPALQRKQQSQVCFRGGNPLAMVVANEVINIILGDGFLKRVEQAGNLMKSGLQEIVKRNAGVLEQVRGSGLLLGLRCKELVLAVGAGENVIRLLLPLNISDDEISEGLLRLERAVRSC
jgi:acetylornithine/N-succinyldiaminopimelate aminotransferase